MLALETAIRNAGETAYGVFANHGRWMVWNTVLALIPLGLALRLFRVGVVRGVRWWLGVAVFIAFLPNAPYVLSDVIHFFDDVRASRGNHDLRVAFVIVPIYVAFMVIGFGSYVVSLDRVRQFVTRIASARSATIAVVVLHALSSVGVFSRSILAIQQLGHRHRPGLARQPTRRPHAPVADCDDGAHVREPGCPDVVGGLADRRRALPTTRWFRGVTRRAVCTVTSFGRAITFGERGTTAESDHQDGVDPVGE